MRDESRRGNSAGSFLAILMICCLTLIAPAMAAENAEKGFDASYVQANLIKGKTTQAEVEEKFGKPTSVDKEVNRHGAEEIWAYDATQKTARGKFRRFDSLVSKAVGILPDSAKSKWYGSKASDAKAVAHETGRKVDVAEEIGEDVSGDNGSNDSFMYLRVFFEDGVVDRYYLN